MSRQRRHWAAVAFAAAVVILAPPGVALAATADQRPHGSVESILPRGDGVDVVFQASNMPAGAQLESDSVQVRLDGRRVDADATPVEEQRIAVPPRRVALVIDTSGSMAGERLVAARAAAAAYLEAVPEDVEVGLVTFSTAPVLASFPTADRPAVAGALSRLSAAGNTSIWDAVLAARDALGSEGERRILVLSDGEDTSSTATAADAATAVSTAGIALDAVVLGDSSAAGPDLQGLVAAGNGRLLRASDAATASSAFQSVALAFDAQLVVHVPVPPEFSGEAVSLRVDVDSAAGPVSAEAPAVLPSGLRGAGFWGSTGSLLLGLAVVFVGLAALLLAAVTMGDTRATGGRRTQQVLAAYTLRGKGGAEVLGVNASRLGSGAVARSALELAGRVVRKRGLEERIALRLDRAQVKFTPAEWVVLHTSLVVASFAVFYAISGFLGGVSMALLVGLGLHLWIGFKSKRRLRAFVEGMPDALQLVASGLSSGYSLPQALDAVVREGQEPIAGEFGRALAEARLGVPLESALDNVADRMDSQDFRWVIMSVRVQREVGGNLAEVLNTVCKTMRDRASLRRQVKALSAEGRMSAWVLIGLPIVLGLWMATTRRDYYSVMWESALGLVLLGGSAVALAVGALWMNKLVKVEM